MQRINTPRTSSKDKISVRLIFQVDASTKDWIKTLALPGSLWQVKRQNIATLLGENVASKIKNAGYPHLAAFSIKSGISSTTLKKIILGKTNPRLSTMKKIAQTLGIPVNELLAFPHANEIVSSYTALDQIDMTIEFPVGSSLPKWLLMALDDSIHTSVQSA